MLNIRDRYRKSKEVWLLLLVMAILALLTAVVAVQQIQEETHPPLASNSNQPDGARALYLWLDELGYQVDNRRLAAFHPPDEADLMLILEPAQVITEAEWAQIDRWVEAGGTLLIAGEGWASRFSLGHYRLWLHTDAYGQISAHTPLLNSPPLENPDTLANMRLRAYFEVERDDAVIHLSAGPDPILLSFQQGAGQVIAASMSYPFTNAGLKEAGNPELVLNLIAAAAAPDGRPANLVWFNEWHHGYRAIEETGLAAAGPWEWLRFTPAGRSLLYTAILIFVVLLLRGRRFGRPVPLPQEQARRSPLEYVTAVANLQLRAGHRAAVLQQYRHWLKRDLGRRYGVDPALPDDEYVRQLARSDPTIDAGALAGLLRRLNAPQVSEEEMIRLAAETVQWKIEES